MLHGARAIPWREACTSACPECRRCPESGSPCRCTTSSRGRRIPIRCIPFHKRASQSRWPLRRSCCYDQPDEAASQYEKLLRVSKAMPGPSGRLHVQPSRPSTPERSNPLCVALRRHLCKFSTFLISSESPSLQPQLPLPRAFTSLAPGGLPWRVSLLADCAEAGPRFYSWGRAQYCSAGATDLYVCPSRHL